MDSHLCPRLNRSEIDIDCQCFDGHAKLGHEAARRTGLSQADEFSIDTSLARVLRGGEFGRISEGELDLVAIMRRVEFHGIAGLFLPPALDRLPHLVRDEVRRTSVSQHFWEAQHIKRLRPLLQSLEERGAAPLLFKGTALAYTRYGDPSSRRRGDTDILVRESSFEDACECVRSFGYRKRSSGLTLQALGARSFSTEDDHGFTHEIDLHQRINSSPIIGKLFLHDELNGRSDPVPKIGPGTRAIGLPDALLTACFHRLTHSRVPYYVDGTPHLSSDRLIWLYDIKMLHDSLDDPEELRVLELAQVKGFSAILIDGLKAADHWLSLDRTRLIKHLETSAASALPYRYLHSSAAKRWLFDLAATEHKGRLLIDFLIPPEDYMQEKYEVRWLTLLPVLYIWRVLNGLYKATQRSIQSRLRN